MKKKLVFALLMSAVTTGIVSFAVVAVNLGFINQLLFVWLKSWLIGYIVAVPSILIIAPQIEKLVSYLLEKRNSTVNH